MPVFAGAIAVNGAIVVGYKLAGMIGAATAILATILPPFLILSILSVFYNAFQDNFSRGADVERHAGRCGSCHRFRGFDMGERDREGKRSFSLVIMAGAFLAACVFEVNVIYVVIASGLIGALRTWIRGRRKKA